MFHKFHVNSRKKKTGNYSDISISDNSDLVAKKNGGKKWLLDSSVVIITKGLSRYEHIFQHTAFSLIFKSSNSYTRPFAIQNH